MTEFSDRSKTAALSAESNQGSERLRDAVSVEVFGYTNRVPAPDGKSFLSLTESGHVDDQTHYYKQHVNVDPDEKSLSSKSGGTVEMLSADQFRTELSQAVADKGGDLGIYVPGIRNLPGEAAYNAAQLSAASGEPFLVADWASSKRSEADGIVDMALEARADSAASLKSQPMVDAGALEWVKRLGGEHVDLLAHSRGSTMLTNTLAEIQRQGLGPVRSATFSHGDKPVEKFTDMFPSIYKAASHMNFLVDPQDRALKLSGYMRFLTTPIVNSRGDIFPSQATIGNLGVSDRLRQVSSTYVPQNYFTVRNETGFGNQRHTPDLGNTVAALTPQKSFDVAGGFRRMQPVAVFSAFVPEAGLVERLQANSIKFVGY